MDAYSKHKKLVNDYMLYYSQGKSLNEIFKRDTYVEEMLREGEVL